MCYQCEFFGCWRSWLFILHSSLFCLRSEIICLCLIACYYGVWELISFFFRWLHMWRKWSQNVDFCAVLSDILWYLSSLQTVLCTFMMDNCNTVDTFLWIEGFQNWHLHLYCFDILMCWTNNCNYHHDVTPFCDSTTFYDMLHCHYGITIHLHQLAMKFGGGYVFAQNKLNHTINWTGSCSPLGCYCTSTYSMSSICLTDSHAICWMFILLLHKCYLLPNIKMHDEHQSYRIGNLIY